MDDSTKILKIKDGKFYYTINDFVDIKDTNIPHENMSFNYRRDIFWKVELLEYISETNTVKIRVIDYSPNSISNFYTQKQKKPVKFILFEKFQWTKLEPQLSFYQESALSDIVEGISSLHIRNNENLKTEEKLNKSDKSFTKNFFSSAENKNLRHYNNRSIKIDENFSFFFKNANFNNGFVSVNFKPKFCLQKEEIKIFNKKILREYHHIRNYFPKYFKKGKKFNIKLNGEVQFGKLINYEATSEEIQSIDEDIISTIKSLIEVELFDSIDTEKVDKSILSVEELIEESELSSPIKEFISKKPQKVLQSIFKIKDVKNKKQLEYLAGFKQKSDYQIKFTLKPLFGFLFYIESGKQNHFCWELLNSHATYVWSFDSNLDFYEKLNDIENVINYIRINGRKKYKQHVKSGLENNFSFSTVHHKNRLTKLKDGFVEWKNELEKILIKPVTNYSL